MNLGALLGCLEGARPKALRVSFVANGEVNTLVLGEREIARLAEALREYLKARNAL